MLLRFTKMHSLGNDFVVIDAITQELAMTVKLAQQLADRHLGVGCNRILMITPPSTPEGDFDCQLYDRQGREVTECASSIRCLVKFVRDRRLTGKQWLNINTASGVIAAHQRGNGQITVEMGVPVFTPAEIPFSAPATAASYTLVVDGRSVEIAAVCLGNPHAIVVTGADDPTAEATLGPLLEHHPHFPQRSQVSFMTVLDRRRITLRTHPRSKAPTRGCRAACAAVVTGIKRDLLDCQVQVQLAGGTLTVEWPELAAPVRLTGSAATIFQGRIRL